MTTLTKPVYNVLHEALRRYLRFGYGEHLCEVWAGLWYPSEAKKAVAEGYVEFVHRPQKKSACWTKLTEKGAEIVQMWIDQGYTVLKNYEDWERAVNADGHPPSNMI